MPSRFSSLSVLLLLLQLGGNGVIQITKGRSLGSDCYSCACQVGNGNHQALNSRYLLDLLLQRLRKAANVNGAINAMFLRSGPKYATGSVAAAVVFFVLI